MRAQRARTRLSNLLFGDVDPSGKLPMTFPLHEADLPRATVISSTSRKGRATRRAQLQRAAMTRARTWATSGSNRPESLCCFRLAIGLSYTRFAYSDVKVDGRLVDGDVQLREHRLATRR